MAKLITFQTQNPHAAGIDIGSEKIFVSTDGLNVTSYGTFTADYRQCIEDLKKAGIKSVAMEATGVYWVAFYSMLQEAELQVCLVNPREVKQVKGRKTDVKDCQWIQKLFSAGLVRQSYIPQGKLREVRLLLRERQDTIEQSSQNVLKIQKALELMNIKLTGILSQVHGASGVRLLEAIVAGERNGEKLLSLCHSTVIRQKGDKILKALEGDYNPTCIFILDQNLQIWKYLQARLAVVDKAIEDLLKKMTDEKAQQDEKTKPQQQDKPDAEAKPKARPKRVRHHSPKVENLHEKLEQLYGVDLSTLSGINDYTALRLLGEIGMDMSRFPTRKHFVSWCGLAPGQNQSGKSNRGARTGHGHRSGQILRECAQALSASKDIAIGAFIRRLKARKGPQIATKAGARKLAESIYDMLHHGKEFVEKGIAKYDEQIREKAIRNLKRQALKYNLVLSET